MNRTGWALLVAMVSCLWSLTVSATDPKTEYDKRIKSAEVVDALGPNFAGDQTNFYTGVTSFSATDVNLPGNNGLSVALGRHRGMDNDDNNAAETPTTTGKQLRAFGDWDLDIPYLSGTFTQANGWEIDSTTPQSRCSVLSQLKTNGAAATGNPRSTGNYLFWEFWQGNTLHLPGGDQTMLLASLPNPARPSTGGPYHWVTKDRWWFSCLATTKNNAGGEAFEAVSPDGTHYTFDWMTSRDVSRLYEIIPLPGNALVASPAPSTSRTSPAPTQPTPMIQGGATNRKVYRKEVFLLPSQITDRFGNWVKYTWSNDAFAHLISITSSDGRTITPTYNAQGFIGSVTDGTRTWTYQYDTNGTLTGVTLPDATRWQYNLTNLTTTGPYQPFCPEPVTPPQECWAPPEDATASGAYVIHPAGARADFTFVSRFKLGSSGQWSYPLSLSQKTISGPGLTPGTWQFSYAPDRATAKASIDAGILPPTITTDAIAPDGNLTRYTFGIDANLNEGQLLQQQQGSVINGVPVFLQQDTHTYAAPSGANSPTAFVIRAGVNPYRGQAGARDETFLTERVLPEIQRQTTLQGVNFIWQVNNPATTGFDQYADPTTITRSSAGLAGPTSSYSRTETTTYRHDTAKWVIGQVATVTDVVTGKVMSQTDYDATSDLPIRTYSVGALQQTLAYNTDGTLLSITDPLGHATTLGSWTRGIPGAITFPDTTTLAAVISPIGSITRVTNQLHTDTNYGYDVMGRMNRITYPVGDTVAWNDTTRSFAPVAVAEYGLPAGHWKQVVQTGNGRTSTFYDAQWHPVLTLSEDTGNAATKSFVVTRFDALGRTVFTSYAVDTLTSVNDALKGMTTVYDVLGRPIQSKQDAELPTAPILTSTTEYLAGFQTRSTNARGKQTTTSYQVFDSPSTDSPVQISLPEGVTTTIARQPSLGKPLNVTRSGMYAGSPLAATRSYVYDDNERLCKTIQPESGATVVSYDAAGNVDWSADGTAFTSTAQSSCNGDRNTLASGTNNRTIRHYDVMNRVTSVETPNRTADLTTTYELDGLVRSLAAVNPGTPTPHTVTTTYGYDKRRLLESESSANATTFYTLGYGYNANAHLGALTYPDGRTVSYTPDALGRATQVTDLGTTGGATYASAIHYYANGAISDFVYGNGIKHTMVQNARKLPARSQDIHHDPSGDTIILDDSYAFDANGNVTDITDQAQGGLTTRGMAYDDLDRLITAVSPGQWGNATYAYDPLDNLRRADQGARQYRYTYDAITQRLSTIKSPAGATLFTLGYDAQGNTTSKNTQAFVFDSANRLNQVTGQQTYRYDGQGRRVQTTDANSTATYWIYSQSGQVLYTSEARRSQNLSYVYLGNTQVATRNVAWGTGTTTLRYQHTDALGSPVAETDADAHIVKRNTYAPYGEAYGSTNIDGTGYTGHVMDHDTGLTYMQQRYYDPQIGRFLSADPMAADTNTAWNFNRYNYAANNPYRFTDPDGRQISGLTYNVCGVDGCDGSGAVRGGGPSVTSIGPIDSRTWAPPPNYVLKPGVRINSAQETVVSNQADEYSRITGNKLIVTDGLRTPREQASRMLYKIRHGEGVRIYRNHAAAMEILNSYRSAKISKSNPLDAMERTISDQVGRGVYISDHLGNTAIDFRSRDVNRRAFSEAAGVAGATLILDEGVPPHLHVQY
ncbi:MAG TPA: RHS repeat-associated core domain-containing protein [Arenimonas sp.]|uniref:RHS repeat domain-containing protein n=1 Tax=Arenimonas sp. TaxID=1872635 RepID=UPI002B759A05|nr:RHS repeat-associated core domain-containing protein [Arenimonas sp.]HMB58065.1 RHS repeat-associated core domain-containing protein [Arenimonas sp.]